MGRKERMRRATTSLWIRAVQTTKKLKGEKKVIKIRTRDYDLIIVFIYLKE